MIIKRLQPERLLATVTIADPENGWDQVEPPFTQAWLECSTIVNSLTYTEGQLEVSGLSQTTLDTLGIQVFTPDPSEVAPQGSYDLTVSGVDNRWNWSNTSLSNGDVVDLVFTEDPDPSWTGDVVVGVSGTLAVLRWFDDSQVNHTEEMMKAGLRVRSEFRSGRNSGLFITGVVPYANADGSNTVPGGVKNAEPGQTEIIFTDDLGDRNFVDINLTEPFASGNATINGLPVEDINGNSIPFSLINTAESIRVAKDTTRYILLGVNQRTVAFAPDLSVPFTDLVSKILDEQGRIIFIQ